MHVKREYNLALLSLGLVKKEKCTDEDNKKYEGFESVDLLPEDIVYETDIGNKNTFYTIRQTLADEDIEKYIRANLLIQIQSIKTAVWIIAGIAFAGLIIGTFIALLVH